jgi:hypothetical protein
VPRTIERLIMIFARFFAGSNLDPKWRTRNRFIQSIVIRARKYIDSFSNFAGASSLSNSKRRLYNRNILQAEFFETLSDDHPLKLRILTSFGIPFYGDKLAIYPQMRLNPGFTLTKLNSRFFPILDRHTVISDSVFSASTMQPFNYYHFITDFVIPFVVASENRVATLFIPYKLSESQRSILRYHKIEYIDSDFQSNTTLLDVMWLPSIFSGVSKSDADFHEYALNKDVVNRAKTERLRIINLNESVYPRRVFVSRRGVSRAPDQLEVIEELFRSNGFLVFNAQDFTEADAIELFKTCGLLVGIHGAGLTNLIYMPEGSTVVELSGGTFKFGDKVRPVFSNLSVALDLRHFMLATPTDVNGWEQLLAQIERL